MLDVLIIGCGKIAGGYDEQHLLDSGRILSHAGAYNAHGGFRIKACVDPDDARREQFKTAWGVEAEFQSLQDCRRTGLSFDVISVCTPTDTHTRTLLDVLELGPKLVFSEKPMGFDVQQAEAVVRAYDEAGCQLAVNYSRRWSPAIQILKKSIHEGQWGELQMAVGRYVGGVFNNASHMLNLLTDLLGTPSVSLVLDISAGDGPGDPAVRALLETPGGVPIYLCALERENYWHFDLSLAFANGIIDIEQGGAVIRRRAIEANRLFPGFRTVGAGDFETEDVNLWMAKAVENIFDAVTAGRPLSSTGTEGLETLRLCEQLYQKARSQGLELTA